jgi:TonB family protein
MKFALLILAGVASLADAAPVAAQNDLVNRYSQWEQRLRERVNDELAYPLAAGKASGDVLVSFVIGADGKPTGVSIRRSSGNRIFDSAAARLVSRLGHVGSIPNAGGQVNEVMLKLSYGDGAASVAQAMQVARDDRAEQRTNEIRDRSLISQPTQVAERH